MLYQNEAGGKTVVRQYLPDIGPQCENGHLANIGTDFLTLFNQFLGQELISKNAQMLHSTKVNEH